MATTNGKDTLLVTVKGNTSLTAFDLATGAKLGVATTGTKPHEITLSKDQKTAFISIYGTADYGRNQPNNEIGVIDLDTMTERHRINLDLYRGPHGLITDHDGNIWVTVEENQSVLVIDPETFQIEQTVWLQVPVHFLAQSTDGAKIYCSHKEYPFISVVDVASRTLSSKIPLPRGAQAVRVSPDGTRLYVGDFNMPLVHVFDCASEELIQTIPLQAVPGWPYPTPDGRFLVVTTLDEPANKGYVELFFAPDLVPHAIIEFEAEPFHAIATPDGDHIYVALSDGRLPKINLETGTIVDDSLQAGDVMPEAFAIVQH